VPKNYNNKIETKINLYYSKIEELRLEHYY
jgi:hypothetical protein